MVVVITDILEFILSFYIAYALLLPLFFFSAFS